MSGIIDFKRQTTIRTSSDSISTNMLGYWQLEESSGTMYDVLGNTNLTAYGSPTYRSTGKINYGINFSTGTNSGARNTSVATNLSPDGDKYTMHVWIYLTTLPSVAGHTYFIIRGSLSATPWENMNLSISTSDVLYLRFTGSSGDNNYTTSSATFAINTWYHIVGVIRGIGTKPILYVNNVSTTGSTTQLGNIYDLEDGTNGFNIGNAYSGASYAFGGILDEVIVWNRDLSSTEVEWLYNSNNGRSYSEF